MSGEQEYYILLRDRKVETVAWSIPGVYTKKDEIEVSRGELLIRKGDLLCVNGNESVAFELYKECGNVAPLFDVQYNLLKAIPTAERRICVFKTEGWIDWGADVKKGDEVYIRVRKDGIKCCSTAVVRYIGTVTGEHPGTMFGVEITDSRYYRLAKQPDWLKLEYCPNRAWIPEAIEKDNNIATVPAKRSTKEPPQASASQNMEAKTANIDTHPLPHGTRVMIMTKDGRKVNGTVRWAGELPLEGKDPKKKIPVYGLETDISVSYNQIEPVIVVKGRPQFGTSSDHGRVFIPQTMVELGEQIKGSDTTEKGTDGTKDTHQKAGVDIENRRNAASKLEKEKAGLAALQQYTPNYTQDPHQPSVVVPAQGDWATQQHLRIGSAVVMSDNINPPMYGTIKWIGTIPQVNGYVAGMELEAPMDGCTDGVCLLDGVHYFDCPPNKGYFCLLEQLVPDQRVMASSKALNNSMRERGQATVEQDQCSQERDQAMKERDQAMKERDQAMKERDQVMKELLERSLGDGAWGNVREGKFRGQQVAVKCVHEAIFSKQTMQRVYREICTMSQVHHPNLVLFIAAVLDDQGGPMIITELLDTTLRKACEDNLLSPDLYLCMDIFRDVASALCYLHGLEEPIIHRDVSSANVLLKAVTKGEWKAKLSDFGSANWAKEASTMGEGAIVYTAPEAYPVHPSLNVKLPPQTTKIDVYSYGILLCEVALREFPDPATLHEMKAKMKAKHPILHSLVLKCTENEPEQRPTMSIILERIK
ncbi:hypothetical protein EMCRGX_G031364 [Ephydatia muelleri]